MLAKLPVWNLLRARRRSPLEDLGSVFAGVSYLAKAYVGLCGQLTLWVVLQDVQIAVAVGEEDVQLVSIREEIRRDHFEILGVFAEQAHFVWFLLYDDG